MPLRRKRLPRHHALAARPEQRLTPVQAPACPQLDWRVSELQAAWPGLIVDVQPSVSSTNTQLLEACRAGLASLQHPTLLVAEQQHAGRGRQGRVWTSVPGASLTCSLAWPLRRPDFSGLSLAVGVALAEALDAQPGGATRIALKWPNDLWLRLGDDHHPGRKLGGILIETVGQPHAGAARVAVIGVGLNVLPVLVPEAGSGVACLHELDATVTAPAVLHRIATPLLRALAEFEHDGFAAFEKRYRARDLLPGRPIEVGGQTGVAAGVAPDGALLLRDRGQVHRIVSGDVSVRLQAHAVASTTAC
jgi:BirA family transcriptional regulator, biotin operon repressor / biotin---[acetyl-CoA-carboxylase] ligase